MVQQQVVQKIEAISKSTVKKQKQVISQEIDQLLLQDNNDENLYSLVNLVQDSTYTIPMRSYALKQLNIYFKKIFKNNSDLENNGEQNDESKEKYSQNKQKVQNIINQFLQIIFIETDRHIRKSLSVFIPKHVLNFELGQDIEYKNSIKELVLQNLQSDDKINIDASLNLIDNYLIEDLQYLDNIGSEKILKILEEQIAPEKDVMIKVSALNAYLSLISIEQENETLTKITTQICDCIKQVLINEEYIKSYSAELLENLLDGIQTNPEFLDKNFEQFFNCVMEINEKQEIVTQTIKFKLLDIIVVYLSEKQKFPIKAPQKYVNQLISGLIGALTPDFEDAPEELTNYDYKFKIEKFFSPYYSVMQTVDELFSIKKIQQFTVPQFETVFAEFLSSNKWQQKFAVIMACSQIVEHLVNLEEVEDEIPQLIQNNIMKIFEASQSPSMMVQLAVAHWIGQLATDIQPFFQQKYGNQVLKLLRKYLDSDNEIIKAHSLAAITNLVEESKEVEEIISEKELLYEITDMSLNYIEKSTQIMLRENSLAMVGSLAECLQQDFTPKLEKSVIIIQETLQSAEGDDYQQIKGQCYETLSLLSAHLKDDFKPYINKLINILLNEPIENITNVHSNLRCYWIDGIRRLIQKNNKEILQEDQEKFQKLILKIYEFYNKLVDQLEYVENEYESEVQLVGKAKDSGEDEEDDQFDDLEESDNDDIDDKMAAAAGGKGKKNELEKDENDEEEDLEEYNRIDFKTYHENILAVMKLTTVGLEDFPEIFKSYARKFIFTDIFQLLHQSTLFKDQTDQILENLSFLLEIYRENHSDLFTPETVLPYVKQILENFEEKAKDGVVDLELGKGSETVLNFFTVLEEIVKACSFSLNQEIAQTILGKIIPFPLIEVQSIYIDQHEEAKDKQDKNFCLEVLHEIDGCQMQLIENVGCFLRNANQFKNTELANYLLKDVYKVQVTALLSEFEKTQYPSYARFIACYCCDIIEFYPEFTEINSIFTILIKLSQVEELNTLQATSYGIGISFKQIDINQQVQNQLVKTLFSMFQKSKPKCKSKKQTQLHYTKDNILSALYKYIFANKKFSEIENPSETFEKIVELGSFKKDKEEILIVLQIFMEQIENEEIVKLINGENYKNTEKFLQVISESLKVITEKDNSVLKKNKDIQQKVSQACQKLIENIPQKENLLKLIPQ